MTDKIIEIYKIHRNSRMTRVEPAMKERDWMDNSPSKFAYRCLPLSIANQHGWCFYLNSTVRFVWNGASQQSAIHFLENDDNAAASVFGDGIVTFHINHLIKSPPGYNIYITGAPNHFISNAQALTGVYESDWAPYSFTMNWKIIEPNSVVTFTEDDPICFFFPVERELVEQFDVRLYSLPENKQLEQQFNMFDDSRREFINSLPQITNPSDQWQKHYFQGKYPDGSKCPVDHKTKLTLNVPKQDDSL